MTADEADALHEAATALQGIANRMLIPLIAAQQPVPHDTMRTLQALWLMAGRLQGMADAGVEAASHE